MISLYSLLGALLLLLGAQSNISNALTGRDVLDSPRSMTTRSTHQSDGLPLKEERQQRLNLHRRGKKERERAAARASRLQAEATGRDARSSHTEEGRRVPLQQAEAVDRDRHQGHAETEVGEASHRQVEHAGHGGHRHREEEEAIKA